MTERFMAMLAMERPSVVTAEDLIRALHRNYPELSISSQMVEPKTHLLEKSGEAYLLDVGGTRITVMFLDQPTPAGTYDGAASHSLHWPDAAQQLKREGAHVIVASLAPLNGFMTAMQSATVVTLVAAAVAALTPCIGVYWFPGETVTEKKAFIDAAERISKGQVPVEIWVQIALFGGDQNGGGEKVISAITTGLCAFVGREVEFQPSAISPVTLGRRLVGTIQYLLMQGPVLNSGDTLGVSERERIRVQLEANSCRTESPVYVLSMEQMDNADV